MRILLFLAGFLLIALGFLASRGEQGAVLLQGGLTLGGGFIICAIFTFRAKWHGIVGAGVLAFLGVLRTLPMLLMERDSSAAFKASAGVICLIVLVGVVNALRAERTRRSIERLKSGEE